MVSNTDTTDDRSSFFSDDELERIRQFAETPRYDRNPDILLGDED